MGMTVLAEKIPFAAFSHTAPDPAPYLAAALRCLR